MDNLDKLLTKLLLLAALLVIIFAGYRLSQFEVIYNSKIWQDGVVKEIIVLKKQISELKTFHINQEKKK